MPETSATLGRDSSIAEPIFIVGATRSGTTLLSLMLGHHPQIVFVGEYEWVWDFAPGASLPLEPYYEWLATHRHFRRHRLRVNRSLRFEDQARDFLHQMRAAADPGKERAHVGCQVHRNYIDALSVWPRARFIHIVRDGRDVCASWIKFGWLGNAYVAGLSWCKSMTEWKAAKTHIDPSRRTELRFEDLVKSPAAELARLCEFVGAPYTDAMLNYHKDTTYEPVDPSQAGKWRQQLSRRDLRVFESVAARELAEQGYAPSGEPDYSMRPWSRPMLLAENALRHHDARVKNFGFRLWLADIVSQRLGLRAWQARIRLEFNEIENSRML